jgi:hypothetical protein
LGASFAEGDDGVVRSGAGTEVAGDVLSAGGAQAEPSAAALRSIAEDLAPFFELVHQQAECFESLYDEALSQRHGELRREHLDALNPKVHAALRRFGDSIMGTGVAPARGVLADEPMWIHWWFDGPAGPEMPRYDFDPDSEKYYDYPTMEWFREPVIRREPYAAGPYFDEGGVDVFLITLTVPVVREDRVVAVATTDVRVDQIDRLCRPHLTPLGRRVALVNRFGRVVASTNHLWATPGHSLDAPMAEWCMQCAGPWHVGLGGRTYARTASLPWGLLVLD